MNKTEFIYNAFVYKNHIVWLITDEDTGRTITNDMDNVVKTVERSQKRHAENVVILYTDTDGNMDGYDAATKEFFAVRQRTVEDCVDFCIQRKSRLDVVEMGAAIETKAMAEITEKLNNDPAIVAVVILHPHMELALTAAFATKAQTVPDMGWWIEQMALGNLIYLERNAPTKHHMQHAAHFPAPCDTVNCIRVEPYYFVQKQKPLIT